MYAKKYQVEFARNYRLFSTAVNGHSLGSLGNWVCDVNPCAEVFLGSTHMEKRGRAGQREHESYDIGYQGPQADLENW